MDSYQETLQKCRQNDRRAQLKFYTIFYKSVYNCSFRIVGNPQEAEELMQETFLKIFDRLYDYMDYGEEAMQRLLKRIVINASLDLLRKRKVKFIELNEQTDFTDEPSANAEDEKEMELAIETIKQGISELPEGYRLILNLHLIDGLEYDEIANQLSVSPSTVRSQYARARKKLTTLVKTVQVF